MTILSCATCSSCSMKWNAVGRLNVLFFSINRILIKRCVCRAFFSPFLPLSVSSTMHRSTLGTLYQKESRVHSQTYAKLSFYDVDPTRSACGGWREYVSIRTPLELFPRVVALQPGSETDFIWSGRGYTGSPGRIFSSGKKDHHESTSGHILLGWLLLLWCC